MNASTEDYVDHEIDSVRRVTSQLDFKDRMGIFKVRLGISRMDYRIEPGLVALGDPTPDSPVLVSANYKMSFDVLRREVQGHDAWILVLDTDGINVWCAAGKGTFGTDELVSRIEAAGLGQVVNHRKVVVPQLGAPGISAHEVKKRSGFRVVYGPVRAADLPAFIDAGMKASPGMRKVRFGLWDRFVLVPVEIAMGGRIAMLIAAAFVLLGGMAPGSYAEGVRNVGLPSAALFLSGFLLGSVLGPVLLPWLPGRAFSVKGATVGAAMVTVLALWAWPGPGPFGSWLHLAAWALILPALTSFVVMNFTGASTYTSLSGVLAEMRIAVRAQIAFVTVGVGLWLTGLFLGGGVS